MSRGVRLQALHEALHALRASGQITGAVEDLVIGIARCCGIAGAEMTVEDLARESNLSERAVYKALPLALRLEFAMREPIAGSRSFHYRIHSRFAERRALKR